MNTTASACDKPRTRLEKAAIDLHTILWRNVGSTTDWPIRIEYDDDAVYNGFVDAMNELYEAIKEIDPALVPWPIPPDLAWRAKD